ncbi:DUF726-domain-containing protein [Cylindrobasidium torrendii FP15055 ss-10]|uniref:DUF726-domain-containing protein n=1 Tax=Cylindrobasidium torrendii FP15055 ss-10 TaxID=1314674 RepID=A0A0D7BWB7_9AGAR|nr:DUF726-domain-containing protein [Cylindrobasidium torrendii FP15055 ss-10]
MPPTTKPAIDVFDDDDDEGWQEMPVVYEDTLRGGLDEEDQKKYHYQPSTKAKGQANATGNVLDVDDFGNEWRDKSDVNESAYTRLRVNEEDDTDEVVMRTKYLFDEDKAMTPLSQMQTTKNLLTEAQRIAYVGLCSLVSRQMAQKLRVTGRKELKASLTSLELWRMKIMGRLYYHMELETQEQKMIESLGEHGVIPADLVPALMTTHTVANPEYDPKAALKKEQEDTAKAEEESDDVAESITVPPSLPSGPISPNTEKQFQTTAQILHDTTTASIPGVTTTLSTTNKDVTLDMRWTILCDLFLILIADSVYDARSRVLLEEVALHLGLGWVDVVRFESRVTEALEIQEDVERMENEEVIEGRKKSGRNKRYMMLGLATLGGGLVIGLSAGLLAPVIGAGLGAALTTVGITGTTGFLAGAGGAAVITTGGVLTGSGIATKAMLKRTQQVRQFDLLPLHNNKRVNCIITVPGFLNGPQDDPRLPFSVLDPIVGDLFSVLWEPEMIRETGSALRILTTEVLSSLGQTVLSATVMTALMGALQWPIVLTKLGYLIDNPWNNSLDRAKAAGYVLADVLMNRHLGVRPITLIGFSLGARVIFYALVELAKHKAYGIVQDVFLLGTTVSAAQKTWIEMRSVVSGRFVNAYARNDWVLNYLFRATSGGVGTVAGLRPMEGVPGLENVDVTDKIAGHMSYRTFMPLILDQLGFPVFSDYFDEPEAPDFEEERIVVKEGEEPANKGWFSRKRNVEATKTSRPPSTSTWKKTPRASTESTGDDDLPPREARPSTPPTPSRLPLPVTPTRPSAEAEPIKPAETITIPESTVPKLAGFDLSAIRETIEKTDTAEMKQEHAPIVPPPPSNRTESMPRLHTAQAGPSTTPRIPSSTPTPRMVSSPLRSASLDEDEDRYPYSTPAFGSSASVSTVGYGPYGDAGDWDVGSQASFAAANAKPGFNSLNQHGGGVYGNGSMSSFGASTASLTANPFSLQSGYGPPPLPMSGNPFLGGDPFGGSGSSAGGLSFGGADGSITSGGDSVMPWKIPDQVGRGKKAEGTFAANPWS